MMLEASQQARLLVLTLALLLGASHAATVTPLSNGQTLKLLVAYCPTDFTAAGAIVSVDAATGDYTIDGTFEWPKHTIFGCDLLYDPVFDYDADKQIMYLSFSELEGTIIAVSLASHSVVDVIKPSDPFFVGFTNFQLTENRKDFVGTTPTVTESGKCSDGCFAYGEMQSHSGKYQREELVLFKAMMDDAHLLDTSKNVYYCQASYDLRDERCAPKASDLCLLTLDGTTGALKSAVHTEFVVYDYGPEIKDDKILGWIEGFPELCQHPYNDFLFATVNLATGEAEPIACIPKDVTVDMDEWISSFTVDEKLFATGSGNAETGKIQVLVFDTATGAKALEATLHDLPAKLKAAEGLLDIWAVQAV